MEDELVGMEGKGDDYLDAIEDMLLFIQSFNLEKKDDREAFAAALIDIEITRSDVKQARFISSKLLSKFIWPRPLNSCDREIASR